MAKREKLAALQTAREVEEQKVLQDRKCVADVVEERQKALDQLLEKRTLLLRKRKELREEKSMTALRAQDGNRAASIRQYERRLAMELSQLEKLVVSQEQELERALERFKLVDEELVGARVERKKVERLLDNLGQAERAADAAAEQAMQDELNLYRRRR